MTKSLKGMVLGASMVASGVLGVGYGVNSLIEYINAKEIVRSYDEKVKNNEKNLLLENEIINYREKIKNDPINLFFPSALIGSFAIIAGTIVYLNSKTPMICDPADAWWAD